MYIVKSLHILMEIVTYINMICDIGISLHIHCTFNYEIIIYVYICIFIRILMEIIVYIMNRIIVYICTEYYNFAKKRKDTIISLSL